MTLKEIIEAKDKALVAVPNQFTESVKRAQSELLRAILAAIDSFEYNAGALVVSDANYAKIAEVIRVMGTVLNQGEYAKAVVELAQQMNNQAALTRDYFADVFEDAFSDKTLYQNALIRSQRTALTALTDVGIEAAFLNPFQNYLTTAISGETSRGELEKAIRLFIQGNEQRLGRLDSYSGQIADDIFSVIDRSYTRIIAEDLDVQFYVSSGSVISDSRQFCVTRHNKYYHRDEVEAWGNLGQWDGKIPGTDPSTIFIYAGGYRCRHSILPVAISSVPKAVIERAESKGLLN